MDLENPQSTKRTRKKVRTESNWRSTIRKTKHNSGQTYVCRMGKVVPAKEIKTTKDCKSQCKFRCARQISNEERRSLFNSYYALSTNEKRLCILNSTERFLTKRPRTENSRRTYTFTYSFLLRGSRIQVCKEFYLGTLNISQKPVYNVHKTKNAETNVPAPDMRGKSINSLRKLPEEQRTNVMKHIKSFPTVESHYCRSSTTRQYLDSSLSVPKMYYLYKEECSRKKISPVKLSMYRHIFVTQFNLGFHIPKSDKCDKCELYRVAKQEHSASQDMEEQFSVHVNEKVFMRNERENDKKNNIPVLIFDLQNVLNIPRAEISSFYYRRKLNIYNLTGYFSTTKTVYCTLWDETQSGRTGNDLASAFMKMLEVIHSENEFTDLITWSDSCIPQNRNSFISNAVLHFLKENPNINSLIMKYSLPGHSCCQEVDSAHSLIEKAMKKTEIYSPLGLTRLLKQINKFRPYRVIQLQQQDFKNFQSAAQLLNYKQVPFLKIMSIQFAHPLHEIRYKTTHNPSGDLITVNLKFLEKRLRRHDVRLQDNFLQGPKQLKTVPQISEAKKKDLKLMLPYMPQHDREYYSELCHT